MTQLSVSGAAVEFGGTTLFSDVTFTVARGERWGLIGRNGSGKTTIFKLVTGDLAPTRGTVSRAGGITVTLLEQHRDFGDAATVWEGAAGPLAPLLELERSLADQATRLGELGDRCTPQDLARYDRDLERFEREGGYTLAPRVDAVLHGLGFDPDHARVQPLVQLSGGERGRLGLARQLVAPGDILLLDEPTNHLDLETTAWLEGYLRTVDATVLLISHDRAFLETVVDHILHVESRTTASYAGGYASFLTQRAERRLTQQRAFDKQRKVLAAEEDFIRRNIAGQKSAQAKGRRRRLDRVGRLSPPPGESGAMALRLEASARGGDQVLVADRVHVAVEGRPLLDAFSARINRGDVIGFVGPNGAGKTTLLKTLVGTRAPDGGEVRIPDSVAVAYYRQDLSQVAIDRSLYDVIADKRPAWGRGAIQDHLGRFGFTGDSVLRQTGTLSGGERARVALALMVLEEANLLVFDEPTNHLDVESIEALEDAIEDYGGTVIIVSHDRALLRSLTTRVWVLHERHITDYPGDFGEWETASVERAHAAKIAAAEDEALRRVKEKRDTRRKDERQPDASQQSRRARRALADAEADVAAREARVTELTHALENPALYNDAGGTRRAHALGVDLDEARLLLDAAFERWSSASAALDRR